MPTTREDINGWINRRPEGTTHMIVACDTFDYEDYPVYYPDAANRDNEHRGKTLDEIYLHYRDGSLSTVMEVYSFTGKHTIEDQLLERRAWYFD